MLEKLKKNYISIIFLFLITYFIFNLLGGERGLISYLNKKKILEELNSDKIQLTKNIESLELKNSLLTENLDLDFIEILIRENFLFGKKGESIYIIKENEN